VKYSTLSSDTLISLSPLPLLKLVTDACTNAPSALWVSLASTLTLRINSPPSALTQKREGEVGSCWRCFSPFIRGCRWLDQPGRGWRGKSSISNHTKMRIMADNNSILMLLKLGSSFLQLYVHQSDLADGRSQLVSQVFYSVYRTRSYRDTCPSV
jgi:hypothetical protein